MFIQKFNLIHLIIGIQQEGGAPSTLDASYQSEAPFEENAGDGGQNVQNNVEEGYPHLNERQKKLFELRLKMVSLNQI